MLFSFQVGRDAVHSLRDVFQRVGVGKSQIAFAVVAEVDAWRDAHVGVFQDIEGEPVGIGIIENKQVGGN